MDNINSIQSILGADATIQQPQNTKELGQSDFLKIMISQLANQDPLNPQENTDFISQMAQFGTNDGIQKLHTSFESLANSLHSNQALQATSLVGKTVQVPSFAAALNENGLTGAVKLEGNADSLNIKISNAAGEWVKTIQLGPQSAGVIDFKWDGNTDEGKALPQGVYQMNAEVSDAGSTFAAVTLASANVNSVTLNQPGKGLMLSIEGVGEVDFNEIYKIISV